MESSFEIDVKKLGDNILSWIGDFLYKEGFPSCQVTRKGVLILLDRIRSYAEEGFRLFPELVLTTSLRSLLQTLPTYRIVQIEKAGLSENIFNKLLKQCAPLALDGWVIYAEISGGNISYGLVTAESSELSASIYQHLVGDFAISDYEGQIAYIKPIGTDYLEIRGLKHCLMITLKFEGEYSGVDKEINTIVSKIISGVDEDISASSKAYLKRLFEDSLRESHGCIVAVMDFDQNKIDTLKGKSDAVFFDSPIDLMDPLRQSEDDKSRESSTILRSYSSLVRRMINHDGISIFSTNGKLIAFNLFYHDIGIEQVVIGGARTRAFKALTESGLFECCLFRSQDGNMEIWEKQND